MVDREHLATRADEVMAALQRDGLVMRGGPAEQPPVEADAVMAGAQTAQTLGRKGVINVGFNALSNEVVIYTAGALTKADRAKLPHELGDGVALRIEPSKQPVVDARPPAPLDNHPGYVERDGRYCCGSSISVGNNREAGTLGCLVRDREGRIYGLTNNHVIGGCSYARIGLPILAPGVMDVTAVSRAPSTIGRFSGVAPMVSGDPQLVAIADNCDAATFVIGDEAALSSWQGDSFDTPVSTIDVRTMATEGLTPDRMVLEKVGRTTGLTLGDLDSESRGPERVSYKLSAHHSAFESDDIQMSIAFDGVLRVKGRHGLPFSLPGDSGSLVVARMLETGERYAMGLLFAGILGGHSYVLPIVPILERFDVELVGGLG